MTPLIFLLLTVLIGTIELCLVVSSPPAAYGLALLGLFFSVAALTFPYERGVPDTVNASAGGTALGILFGLAAGLVVTTFG